LAAALADQGNSVSIIDKSARAFRRLPDSFPGERVVGSGFDRDDLERAGAVGAGALAAVTSGDNTNILTVRIARETYEIPNVVARIYDPRRAEIYQRLGIPTVATVTWTIDQVRRRLVDETTMESWSDATGQLAIVEQNLPAAWAGRPLRELEEDRLISVVALTRAGVPRIDARDLIGQEGDILHLAVTKVGLDTLEHKLALDADDSQPDGDTVGGPRR
jgi:trk system potassium uptake protein TrkA